MRIGTSMMTNIIYAGNTKRDKNGMELWTKKEDVTNQAIQAVFEHMYTNAKETGVYEISVEGFGKMTFVREKK